MFKENYNGVNIYFAGKNSTGIKYTASIENHPLILKSDTIKGIKHLIDNSL